MIRLKTIFKVNPDPNNSRHKKGDARFKDNLEFVRERLLQAYAYRVVEAYHHLLAEGIDYNSTTQYLDEVRKESNHLHTWLEAQSLTLCSIDQGMSSSKCYKQFYLPWAVGEGYVEQNSNFGSLKYHHPHERYDQAVTNQNRLLQRLKEALPSIEHKRTNQGTVIGLKCLGSPQYPYSTSIIESVTDTMQ